MITQQRLKEALEYDAASGMLRWRMPASRAVKPGQLAGRVSNRGYRQIMVDGVRYAAHRLVWLWHHGAFPEGEIDHRNGARDDNRIENLRVASRSENQQNIAGAQKDNKTGFLGVSFHAGNRWRAQISHDGRKRYLGLFSSPEDAHAAYLKAKATLHTFQPTLRSKK